MKITKRLMRLNLQIKIIYKQPYPISKERAIL